MAEPVIVRTNGTTVLAGTGEAGVRVVIQADTTLEGEAVYARAQSLVATLADAHEETRVNGAGNRTGEPAHGGPQ